MAKTRLDELVCASDKENIHLLFHLTIVLVNSRVSSAHPDTDFISLLGLLQSHLLRCHSEIVHDNNIVDWESSQKAMLLSLDTSES